MPGARWEFRVQRSGFRFSFKRRIWGAACLDLAVQRKGGQAVPGARWGFRFQGSGVRVSSKGTCGELHVWIWACKEEEGKRFLAPGGCVWCRAQGSGFRIFVQIWGLACVCWVPGLVKSCISLF